MERKDLKPGAFMCYARKNDRDGTLTKLREKLSEEVEEVIGEEFPIFQDIKDIEWGEDSKERIDESLSEVTFFIPIITPNFFKSDYCRYELKRFLGREKKLGRNDLVLPIYYIEARLLEEEAVRKITDQDGDSEREIKILAQIISDRQRPSCADWRTLRSKCRSSFNSEEIYAALEGLATQIRNALTRIPTMKTEQKSREMKQQASSSDTLFAERIKALNSAEHSRWAVSPFWNHDQLVEKLKLLRNEMEKLVGPLYANMTDSNIFISNDENELSNKMIISEIRIREEFYKTDEFWKDIYKNLYLSQSEDLTMLLKTYMKCIENYRKFISAENHETRKLLAKNSTDTRLYKAENIVYDLKNIIENRYDELAKQIEVIQDELGISESSIVVDQMSHGNYVTISEAIRAARPGDKIVVRPGIYQEGLVIDKPLEIIGDGERDEITVQAEGKNVILFKTTVGLVANLTLRQIGGGNWDAVDISQGRLTLEGCDISSQRLACVSIHDGADPLLRGNVIHDGKQNGVHIYDNGCGKLENNDIITNASAGVEINGGANPSIYRNRISRNKLWGIWAHDNGSGIVEGNDLRDNIKGAWSISHDSEPNVKRSGNLE